MGRDTAWGRWNAWGHVRIAFGERTVRGRARPLGVTVLCPSTPARAEALPSILANPLNPARLAGACLER